MKKLIALLLAFALCFGLCACGQNADEYEEYEDLIDHLEDEEYEEAIQWILELAMEEEEKGSDDAPVNIGEDPALEEEYNNLVNYLETLEESIQNDWTFSIDYIPEGSEETVWLYGSDAYLQLYERLTALGDYKDSQELAARFTVLDNKLLNITEAYTDALGNVNEYTGEDYTYNTEGVLVQGPAPEEYEDLFWGTPNYEYDDSGKLVCLRSVNYDGSVSAILNITYNADGTVASTDFKNADGHTETRSYVYESGLPTQCTITDSYYTNSYIETYTCNAAGQVERTEKRSAAEDSLSSYVDVIVYTYDAAGRVASKRVSEFYYWDGALERENYVHNWEYTYDDAGNILTALDTHLGSFDKDGQQTDTNLEFPRTHTYNYGTYCVYTPVS